MFRVAYRTDVGLKRESNQDAVKVCEDLQLCIVADGMGGHKAGEVASSLTVDSIEKFIRNVQVFDDHKAFLTEALKVANKTVYLKALDHPEYRGMGTTCSLVMQDQDYLHVAHVGDSRVYFIKENDIEQITEDHTLVESLVKSGEITKAASKSHPKRHVITRAIGTEATIEVDYYRYHSDQIKKVLVCSDGLTEKIDDQELYKTIESNTLESAVEALVNLANDRGGTDNITIIIMVVEE